MLSRVRKINLYNLNEIKNHGVSLRCSSRVCYFKFEFLRIYIIFFTPQILASVLDVREIFRKLNNFLLFLSKIYVLEFLYYLISILFILVYIHSCDFKDLFITDCSFMCSKFSIKLVACSFISLFEARPSIGLRQL